MKMNERKMVDIKEVPVEQVQAVAKKQVDLDNEDWDEQEEKMAE